MNHINVLSHYHENNVIPKQLRIRNPPIPILPNDIKLKIAFQQIIRSSEELLLETTIEHLKEKTKEQEIAMNKVEEQNPEKENEIREIITQEEHKLKEKIRRSWTKAKKQIEEKKIKDQEKQKEKKESHNPKKQEPKKENLLRRSSKENHRTHKHISPNQRYQLPAYKYTAEYWAKPQYYNTKNKETTPKIETQRNENKKEKVQDPNPKPNSSIAKPKI